MVQINFPGDIKSHSQVRLDKTNAMIHVFRTYNGQMRHFVVADITLRKHLQVYDMA